ncbi:hypothetical protein [Myceligenerans crystallogenes]
MAETTVEAPGGGRTDGARIDLAAVELLALVSMRRNTATDRARALLGLPEDGIDSPVTTAGVGSLLARRLATVAEGRLAPLGPVNEIASILMNAVEWIEAIGTTDDASNVAAVIRSPEGTVLLEPRPYDVWNAWPLSQGDPLPVIGARFVASAFGNLPRSRPFSGSVRVVAADATTRSAVVTVSDDEAWTLASGPGGDISEPAPITPDPTFQVLATTLA